MLVAWGRDRRAGGAATGRWTVRGGTKHVADRLIARARRASGRSGRSARACRRGRSRTSRRPPARCASRRRGRPTRPRDDPNWQAQLRRIAHDLRLLALRHPNVVPLLVTRPLSTPLGLRPLGTLRPLEQILSLLIDAGFAPEDALHVYRAYYGYLYGHILNELQEFIVDPDENEALLRLGLHRLPPKDFPRLRALAPVLADYDGKAELDEGITILLSGLAARLSPGA